MKKTSVFLLFGFLAHNTLWATDICMDPQAFQVVEPTVVPIMVNGDVSIPMYAPPAYLTLRDNSKWCIDMTVSSVYGRKTVFLKAKWSESQGLTCQYKTDENGLIILLPKPKYDIKYKKEQFAEGWEFRNGSYECNSNC